ncbi:MAG: hypothetical protein JWP84_3693 [Tardiphaga sp.]|nr:hypothetical protein [Tardiphaga sp.]
MSKETFELIPLRRTNEPNCSKPLCDSREATVIVAGYRKSNSRSEKLFHYHKNPPLAPLRAKRVYLGTRRFYCSVTTRLAELT